MPSPPRVSCAAVLLLAAAIALPCCGRPAGRRASDKAADLIRNGGLSGFRSWPANAGWDNDSLVDAYVDVIAHGDEAAGVGAALGLSSGMGIQCWEPPANARGLDFTLPARVAPILLAALREGRAEWVQYRGALLLALGAIDKPSSEVVATVVESITEDAPSPEAVRAVGMLGVHAAGAAGDLNRLLSADEGDAAVGRVDVAGALARVSDATHPVALDILIRAAEGKNRSTAAIDHLRALGPRARPAADVLLACLSRGKRVDELAFEATLAVSPDELSSVLTTLLARATSEDAQEAWSATSKLDQLSRAIAWTATGPDPARLSNFPGPGNTYRVYGSLTQLSDRGRADALAALVATARGDSVAAATLAVDYLRDLGPAAGSVTDDLMAILGERRVDRPPVAEAIATISPALFPAILATLAELAGSADGATAAFADHELANLSESDDLIWGRSDEMLAVVPALIAVVEARPAPGGAAVAGALRRIGSSEGQAAYNAYVGRERQAAREGGVE